MTTGSDSTTESARPSKLLTVPNTLCVIRLLGSPLLIVLAVIDQPYWFLGLFLVLMMTDWFDGKLARLLNQRSAIGPQLDSVADYTMYASLLVGTIWLRTSFLRSEWPWIVLPLSAYLISAVMCLIKFRRLPMYHTRFAKTCWALVAVAVVFVIAEGSAWPFRIAMLGITLTCLEAAVITLLLPRWRTDIPSFVHVLTSRRAAKAP